VPCILSAILWIPGLSVLLNFIVSGHHPLQETYPGAKVHSIEYLIFFTITPWLGLIGTMIISKIFKCVLDNKKIPLNNIYYGLAISPLLIYFACFFPTYLTLLFIMFPILSLFLAMLYNRSWAKHQGVVLDAH
jgi:hypothetical protein